MLLNSFDSKGIYGRDYLVDIFVSANSYEYSLVFKDKSEVTRKSFHIMLSYEWEKHTLNLYKTLLAEIDSRLRVRSIEISKTGKLEVLRAILHTAYSKR